MSDEEKAGENKSRRSTMGLLLAISGIGGGIAWVGRNTDESSGPDTTEIDAIDEALSEVDNNTTSTNSNNKGNISEPISNTTLGDSDNDSISYGN